MFGYITICRPELKVKEYDTYRTYYCGLCHSLKERYGQVPRLTLSFDMTFLAILLSGLYEEENRQSCGRCLLHPMQKHCQIQNACTDYAADMNILLSYYDLADDWIDDRNVKSLTMARILKKKVKKIRKNYPRQAQAVEQYVHNLSRLELEKSTDLDAAAGLTGRMFGEIFVIREDLWSPSLRRLGFFLGKFIYLMDAWEDLPKDLVSGSYNPWRHIPKEKREETSLQILNMMMSECSLAFERLPIIENTGILRNILYSGVWNKYKQIKENQRNDV